MSETGWQPGPPPEEDGMYVCECGPGDMRPASTEAAGTAATVPSEVQGRGSSRCSRTAQFILCCGLGIIPHSLLRLVM